MHMFSRHGKEKGIDKDLLSKIRDELEAKYSRPERGQEFISGEHALNVLTRERVGDLFRPLAWYKEKHRNQIYPHMGVIICILITINFKRWNEFKTIFSSDDADFSKPKLLDKDLPIDDVRALPEFLRLDFERQQYTFCPIVITKDSHKEYGGKYRWPIMRTESILNVGAQGDVDKVYIETGYLEYSSSVHNTKPKLMARKRITTETRRGQKSSFTEKYNLEQFKKSLSNHGNIMQSFASFVYGSDFVILSDWADGRDLHHFLYQPDQVWIDYLQKSTRFTPHNLLSEAYALAEALDFLHYRMVNNSGGRYRCAHLDLKPENILVCIPDSGNPADAPVGRWKITDFGLSNVELSVARNELVRESPATANVGGLAPGTILAERSVQRRGPGPFQPPEVRDADTAKVSTRRDVWSYGCILAMVLAFALGGPEEVAYQQQLRSRGADDFFYERESSHHHGSHSSHASSAGRVDARIKPEIVDWLKLRAPRIAAQHAPWVQLCSDLVLRLLEVDVVERPEMVQAVADLEALLTHTVKQGHYRIWGFDASSLAPEAVPIIPELPSADDMGSTISPDPCVGLVPGSPSASTPEPRSPISNRSRSTISGITVRRPDPSIRSIRLQTMPGCRYATLCPTGLTAALWNVDGSFIYDLSNTDDGNEIWQSSRPRSSVQLTDPSCPPMFQILVTPGFEVTRMAINGSYLAVLEYSRLKIHVIRIYSRDHQMVGQRFAFAERLSMQIASPPDVLKLSSLGSCLLRYSDKIQYITLGGSTDIPIGDADVMGFDFTGDGRAFCLWIRDGAYHNWTVRNAEGRILSPSMTYKCSNVGSQRLALEAFLIPFQSNARFIACDKHGNVFLVCADYGGERVQWLGHTENIFDGLMFPTDDAFLLIRASEYSKQKLQRINLTSMSNRASFQYYDYGVMPKDVDKTDSGICLRTEFGVEGSTGTCLLTLRPNGRLVRKTFHR